MSTITLENIKAYLEKGQTNYYFIQPVLAQLFLTANGEKDIVLTSELKGVPQQEFTFIEEGNKYLIKCKKGGFLSVGDDNQIVLKEKEQNNPKLLFTISQKIGQKGYRIQTYCQKCLQLQKNEQKGHYSVVQGQLKSLDNKLWNFIDRTLLKGKEETN